MTDLVITFHSSRRQAQRGVSEEEIRDTVLSPATTMPGGKPGRTKYIGQTRLDGTRVVVVAVPPDDYDDKMYVVTCWIDNLSDNK